MNFINFTTQNNLKLKDKQVINHIKRKASVQRVAYHNTSKVLALNINGGTFESEAVIHLEDLRLFLFKTLQI
jgi:hypothetical protein